VGVSSGSVGPAGRVCVGVAADRSITDGVAVEAAAGVAEAAGRVVGG
jgi:hypothetical protein